MTKEIHTFNLVSFWDRLKIALRILIKREYIHYEEELKK